MYLIRNFVNFLVLFMTFAWLVAAISKRPRGPTYPKIRSTPDVRQSTNPVDHGRETRRG